MVSLNWEQIELPSSLEDLGGDNGILQVVGVGLVPNVMGSGVSSPNSEVDLEVFFHEIHHLLKSVDR